MKPGETTKPEASIIFIEFLELILPTLTIWFPIIAISTDSLSDPDPS